MEPAAEVERDLYSHPPHVPPTCDQFRFERAHKEFRLRPAKAGSLGPLPASLGWALKHLARFTAGPARSYISPENQIN